MMRKVFSVAVFWSCSLASGFAGLVPESFINESKNNFGATGSGYLPNVAVWHCGWDIICPVGTPVRAIAEGVIVACSPGGWDSDGRHENYALVIEHKLPDGKKYFAIYGHLQRPYNQHGQIYSDPEVRSSRLNQSVNMDEVIGYVGEYSPPHLHFGIYFNENLGSPPTTGLGRQPLPRPQETLYRGNIKSYGPWRDPRAWLETMISRVNVDNIYPAIDFDAPNLIYFIKRGEKNDKICRSDLSSGRYEVITEVAADRRVEVMFCGPDQSLFISTSGSGDRHYLQLLQLERFVTIFEQVGSFTIGTWHKDHNYMPILRSTEWEVLDLNDNQIKDRSYFLNPGGWMSLFLGEQYWCIFTHIVSDQGNHLPATWIVGAHNQKKIPIEGFDEADYSNLVLLDDDDLSDFAVSQLYGGHYCLLTGKLQPKNDNNLTDGFKATNLAFCNVKIQDADIFPEVPALINDERKILATARGNNGSRIIVISESGDYYLIPQ